MKEREKIVTKDEKLSIRKQCELLSVNRSNLYYENKTESSENLQIMKKIDEHHLNFPTHGVLRMQILTNGKPEIVNSDQGSQFTCDLWIDLLKKENIKISMDSKGRALDNIYIERFWRTITVAYIYLHPSDDGLELYNGIKQFINLYNNHQAHQGIGRKILVSLYKVVA